jgi:S1-C subfamily serine protease
MRKFLVPVVLLAVLATACSVKLGSADPSPATAAPLSQPTSNGSELSVEDVVKRVLPSVVNVTSELGQGKAVGTGFIVRADGVIVTNCHVVEGASKLTVSTSADKPVAYDARVIGADCLNDVAVIKVDASDLPTVDLGSSDGLVLGQSVVALGYALALEGGPSVSTGIVSGLNRTLQAQDPDCGVCSNGVRTYTGAIQTDAAINHGNSGGPLVDMQGRVIGINSAGDDKAQNIGFAIAIDSIKTTLTQAESDPLAPAAYLGVQTQTVDADVISQHQLATDRGAFVAATPADGPAAGAGVAEGDVIITLDGQQVLGQDDLATILAKLSPGDRVTVEVVGQDGTTRSIDVTLGSRPVPAAIP